MTDGVYGDKIEMTNSEKWSEALRSLEVLREQREERIAESKALLAVIKHLLNEYGNGRRDLQLYQAMMAAYRR